MPFVNNNGVKIHYEVEGQGSPLVMQHGLTNSLESWRESGFVDGLVQHYRLIMIDARGHGISDKPHDPMSYRPVDFTNDVVAVLNKLEIKKSGYLGYSMGGSIGFHGIARYALSRFDYLVLGGMSPYYTELEMGEIKPRLVVMQMAAEQGMEAYVSYLEKRDGTRYKAEARARVLANDPVALFAVLNSMVTWPGAEDTD